MSGGPMLQPYELVVHKVLPTIRARLARILLEEYRMKQVEVADRLGVTQATVSHYNTYARGYDDGVLSLFPEIEGFVIELARDIAEGLSRRAHISRMNAICWQIMYTDRFCNYHRKVADLDNCNVCYEAVPG
ncbi:MAG: transcriptional regulator [Thermoplasmata archaeon]